MDHIHLYPPQADIPAIQAWYTKVFAGGLPGKRQRVALPGLTDCDYFHRFNLSFSAGEGKLAPTRGRGSTTWASTSRTSTSSKRGSSRKG